MILLGEAAYDVPGMTLHADTTDEIASAINSVLTDKWKPEQELTHAFLDYLKNQFLVHGAWRHRGTDHLNSVKERFKALM